MWNGFMRRSICHLAPVLAAIGALTGCGSSTANTIAQVGCQDCTVLTGANVFDGTRGGPGTVVLRGERVEQFYRGDVEVVAGQVVKLEGRTILPGLIDLHVHIRPSAGPTSMADHQDATEAHFKSFLRSGVTTVLDLGTERHVAFAYRRRIRDGLLLAPSMFAAGPGLTPTGGHPCYEGRPPFDLCAFVDSADDATRVVSDLGKDGPDVVKVLIESGSATFPLPELEASSLAAIRAAADVLGVPVAAHVSESADMHKALDAGVRLFAHLPVRDRIDDELVQRLVSLGAVVIPTAEVVDARYRVAFGALDEVDGEDAFLDIPQNVVAAWRDPSRYPEMTDQEMKDETSRRRANILANIRTCHEHGVLIAAGSDAGNPATFHGLALRRELSLYVEAGLNASEALRAATMDAAKVLGLSDRGRIAKGVRADLVVVRGDPTVDIADLSNVERVFLLGEQLDPADLHVSGDRNLERTAVTGLSDGEPCLGKQECGAGLTCTSFSRCRRACTNDATCVDGQACFELDSQTDGSYCHPGDGCDPIVQDCPNAIACIWLGAGATRCWYPGKGVAGDPCASWGTCAPGFQCDATENLCVRLCDPMAAPPACEDGQTCVDRTADAGRTIGECR